MISSLTLAAMLGALVWRLLDTDPENRVVAAALVVVFAVVTAALVRIRVRLRVVDGGIAVTGPLHTRRIPWTRIRTIGTPRRGRFGRRGTLLELEVAPEPAGQEAMAPEPDADDELLTFGAFDLGTDPAQVGRVLRELRTGRSRHPGG